MTMHFISQGILSDLQLENLNDKEQEKVLNAIGDRVQNIIIHTLLRCATDEQKDRIIFALKSEKDIENTIIEVAGEIPEFSKILEQALLTEYEHIKQLGERIEA